MKRTISFLFLLLLLVSNCTRVKKTVIPFFEGVSPSEDGGIKVASQNVSGKVESLVVTPATTTIAKDTATTLQATAVYSDGSKADVTDKVTWSSTPTEVTTVESKGVAKGVSSGNAKVTATMDSLSGNASLKVTDAQIVSIQVSKTSTMDVGTSTNLKAVAIFSDGSSQDITDFADWSSSNSAIVISNDDSSKGKTTVNSSGQSDVTVSFKGITGSTTVSSNTKTISSISIEPSISIVKGAQKTYTATAIYSDGSTQDITNSVTWICSDSSIGNFDPNSTTKGLLTGLATGAAVVTATFNGVSGTSNLTVTAPKLVSIKVEAPNGNSMAQGTNKQYKAIAIFDDGSSLDVTDSASWSSGDSSIAGVGNAVGANGVVYGLSQGNTVIMASLNGKTGSAGATIVEAALVSISVTGSTPIFQGTSQQFSATGIYTDGSSQNITSLVTWSSSNESIASVSNVSGTKGKVSGDSAGTSNIIATLNGISGGKKLTVNVVEVASISVSPANPSKSKGLQQQFTATAIFTDNTSQDVTNSVAWTSTDSTKVGISNSTGTKGIGTALDIGSSTIKATLNGVSGSTTFTVTPATIVSISVDVVGGSTIAKGTSKQLSAIATLTDGTTVDVTNQVTWSSGDSGISSVGNTIGSKGLAQAVSEGTTSITASLNGISGSSNLTVSPATLVSISVSGNSNVAKGLVSQFTATGTYSDGSIQNITNLVTWIADSNGDGVDDSTYASISNVSGTKGLVTTTSIGSKDIKAVLGTVSGTGSLNVLPAEVTSISITPGNSSKAKGLTQNFVAIATLTDNSTQDITNSATWKSDSDGDNVDDSAIVSISNAAGTKGLATTNSVGATKVSASWNGVTGTTNFSVTAAELSSISVTPDSSSIAKGLTQKFIATGTYTDGTTQNITESVVWSSSNTGNVSISNTAGSKGTASADAVGSSTITASLGSVKGTTNLNVTSATLVSIGITPSNPSKAKGLKEQFTATGIYTDNSTLDITNSVAWSSSASSIVGISSAGLGTALSVGSSTINASLNGISASTFFTVTSAEIVSIVISPKNTSKAKGLTQQFNAVGTYTDDSTQDITSSVAWKSDSNGDGVDDSSVASISNTVGSKGLANASFVGNTVISASLGSVNASTNFAVTPATLSSIEVTPVNPSIAKGLTSQFTATGTYSDGSMVNITNSVTWSSSNSSTVATISNVDGSRGKASSYPSGQGGTGSTTITATLGSVSGSTNLTVTSATLSSIAIIPANGSLVIPATLQFSAQGTFSDNSVQDITSLATWKSDSNGDNVDDSTIATISNASGTKGLLSGNSAGSTTVSAIYNSISSNSVPVTVTSGSSSTQQVAGYDVSVPTGLTVGSTPTGDFSGLTYNNNNGASGASGFISSVPDYGKTSCSELGSYLVGVVSGDTPFVSSSSMISSNVVGTAPNCSAVYNMAVTTGATRSVTEVSNELIKKIGVSASPGTVSSLPSDMAGETTSNQFRVILQVTYSQTGTEIVGVGVSTESKYPANEALLTNFLNGTNINAVGIQYASKTDSFTGAADPKVDFVWVVDNSGSMKEEQSSVKTNAATFFTKLSTKHLDFRLGVITTDSYSMRSAAGKTWTVYSDGSSAFVSNVDAGTSGSGEESGIYEAVQSLEKSTVVPRTGAKLIFVILSDEGDQYECKANSKVNPVDEVDPCKASTRTNQFDPNNNVIKNNQHKVYTIIGLKSSGQPGTCSGSGTSADNVNNAWPAYYNLAQATGGSSASICSNDYSSILDNIATQAAATSSSYVLNRVPVGSSIVVKVNGNVIGKDATNGWSFNQSNNSIVFSGSAWPVSGSNISVSYQYDPSIPVYTALGKGSNDLMAYLTKATDTKTKKFGIAILIGAGILLITVMKFRKKQ